MRLIVGTVALIGLLFGLAYFALLAWANKPNVFSSSSDVVIFEVLPGQSFKKIVQDLQDKRLISSALYLRVYARLESSLQQAKVGEYDLKHSMSPREILQILHSGKSRLRAVTVSEGLNIFEIADIVEKQGVATSAEFLKLVRNPKVAQALTGERVESLEGYLYPETYAVTKYTTAAELVKTMVAKSLKTYDELFQRYQKAPNNLPRHQVFTLASIIEKETGAPEERPLIASVFHNRLRKGMKLQTDPTVIYGFWVQSGKALANIRRSDLLTPHNYNTYVNYGLPRGPIANPGRESLEAALHPAQSEYLFFVSKNAGTHYFSTNLKDHEAAVKQYQMNPSAREGKSWRQLKTEK